MIDTHVGRITDRRPRVSNVTSIPKRRKMPEDRLPSGTVPDYECNAVDRFRNGLLTLRRQDTPYREGLPGGRDSTRSVRRLVKDADRAVKHID
jgi:hypothetical protein